MLFDYMHSKCRACLCLIAKFDWKYECLWIWKYIVFHLRQIDLSLNEKFSDIWMQHWMPTEKNLNAKSPERTHYRSIHISGQFETVFQNLRESYHVLISTWYLDAGFKFLSLHNGLNIMPLTIKICMLYILMQLKKQIWISYL